MRIFLLTILTLCSYSARLQAQKPASQESALFTISENNKIGYIDQAGKVVLPPIYLNGGNFSEGLAPVRPSGRYGFIDETGHYVIAPQFDWAGSFVDGLALVYKDGRPYFIDHNGHSPFACDYAALGHYHHGLAYVETHSGKQGFINHYGRLIIDTIYDRIGPFHDGLAIVHKRHKKDKDKIAVIDTLGHVVIPFGVFEDINDFNEGYTVVETKSGNTGVVDRTGKLLFSRPDQNHIFFGTSSFYSGLAVISLYKYWLPEKEGNYSSSRQYDGFIDLHNHVLLDDTTIDRVSDFSEGRAFIKHENEDYCMIDTHMQTVGATRFSGVQEGGFVNGYAIAETEAGWGTVDTNAHFVTLASYDGIDECWVIDKHFFFRLEKGDTAQYGVAALNGKEISKPCLDYFDPSGFINGLLKVGINGKMAYLDTLGSVVWKTAGPADPALSDLNIDFMLRGHFYAYSSPDKVDQEVRGGGWDSLGIKIDDRPIDTVAGSYRAFPVYVFNTTRDTCQFRAEDSRLYMKTQALDERGAWKDIDYLPHSWCGNSYHIVALEPGAYWKFTIPRFDGEITTKLRIELLYIDKLNPKNNKALYSNSIDGKINPAQFWKKQPYYPQGIMDPYVD